MGIDVNDVNDRDFISDIFATIDGMNEREIESYLKVVEDSINNCITMSEEIALTKMKNRAKDRLIVLEREALRV